MTRPTGIRGRWLIPCTVAGALLTAVPAGAAEPAAELSTADDPRVWLEKMNQALATRNYDGTFMHVSDGRAETMRIVHRVRGGRVTERLLSLDGSGREFVRKNDVLTCYLPDEHTVLVEPRQERGPFLGSLPRFGTGVDEFYRIEALPGARVLGRPVRVIAVNPKDQFRFGYRLWLDDKTAMPLKTELCDSRGHVVEQIIFARLEMPESIPESELTPAVRTDGMRWIRQNPQENAAAALYAFRASQLPPGFHLTSAGTQTLGDSSAPTSHLVYSDGLSTVSVFVEDGMSDRPDAANGGAQPAPQQPPMLGLSRVGSGYAFSTVIQGHQVTAVGEVPAATVEYIAHSVKSYSVSELPQR